VLHVDRGAKTLTVKTADGAEETSVLHHRHSWYARLLHRQAWLRMSGDVAGSASLCHRGTRPAGDSFPLRRAAHSQSGQIPGRTARRVPVRRRCRRTLCRVRSPRRRIHSGTWQHAMAQAGVRSEGLRWPSAGFRREPVAFFQAFVAPFFQGFVGPGFSLARSSAPSLVHRWSAMWPKALPPAVFWARLGKQRGEGY